MRIFLPFRSATVFTSLAPPAAHLHAGVARGERDDAEVAQELAHQLEAAAVVDPRVLLALVQAEGQRRVERERLVLADEVVARGVRALDGALLQRVHHAEGGHDLAAREHADLELAAGERLDALGDDLAAAVDGVQALGEARGAAPADVRQRRGLRDGLRDGCGACGGCGAPGDELAAIHVRAPWLRGSVQSSRIDCGCK
jgi:hypothetical protein